MQDVDRCVAAVAEGFDGRTTGIARCCADNGGAGAGAFQRPIHQAGQQLHGHVLEGNGGAVKQFQQEVVGVELLQRCHRLVGEGGISLVMAPSAKRLATAKATSAKGLPRSSFSSTTERTGT